MLPIESACGFVIVVVWSLLEGVRRFYSSFMSRGAGCTHDSRHDASEEIIKSPPCLLAAEYIHNS
jgi:hypothetical protein